MTADDIRASTAAAYDQIADEFVRRNHEVPADFAEFRASFVARVRRGGRVADLGCGPGRDAAHFLAAGLEVVGVDASREMALRVRRNGIPVAQADIRDVPLRPDCLDGIWSAASLLHVPRGDVARTLRSWWQLLRAEGVLGLSTSLGDDEGWEACPYDPSTQPTTAPLRRWFVHHDHGALVEMVEVAGFDVLGARERVSHRRWLQMLACRRDD
jgi:SAM-dependent methyltransferase